MEKYIVIGKDEPEKTKYEYDLGEVITVNSFSKYRCNSKKIIDGKLYQFFGKGRIVFDY